MKYLIAVLLLGLTACSHLTPAEQLHEQCQGVMAESLRRQMGCGKNPDARAQLFQQCQAACNGGVDSETVDRCLSRCEEFLEKQQQ
jgi:hypothetical protein